MRATFDPERLGAATTVSLVFQIGDGGAEPPPLSSVELSYPPNLGFVTSGLGLAACSRETLEGPGPEACPPNSRMGYGRALVGIPVAPAFTSENVQLKVFAGPSADGYLHVLIYALGVTPVVAELVLSGVLRAGHLDVTAPPIPSFPGAPFVSLVRMRLTLGGKLTYYERVGSRTVAYHPVGVGLPRSCPPGGFPFAASFTFIDGSSSQARTLVSCPRGSV
jgi:hypothetical protein